MCTVHVCTYVPPLETDCGYVCASPVVCDVCTAPGTLCTGTYTAFEQYWVHTESIVVTQGVRVHTAVRWSLCILHGAGSELMLLLIYRPHCTVIDTYVCEYLWYSVYVCCLDRGNTIVHRGNSSIQPFLIRVR